MVKGWKAGLLALTALTVTTPAFAQRGEGGDRGGRGGGMERPGNPGGGGERRGWSGNPSGGTPGGFNRGGNDGPGNRGWQNASPRPEVRPPETRPTPAAPNPGAPSMGWQNQNRDRGQNRDRDWSNRNQPGRDWNRNDDNRGWNRGDNRPGGRPGFARPDPVRPDFGRPGVTRPGFVQPGFARPGNDWNDRGPRLNNSDRWRDQQRWSNNWRRDSRYDWQRYRQNNRGYYQMPAYRPPLGWNYGYSRFSIGVFLGSPLFSNSYWLDDPYSYRLPPAYGTLRWVRYYDDALLVDIRDGYVVDVIHDFFW